jgi:hypothetical protein
MTGNGVPRDYADAVLGHVVEGTAATYDRHDYFVEKRAALEVLAAAVERAISPPDPAGKTVSPQEFKAAKAAEEAVA